MHVAPGVHTSAWRSLDLDQPPDGPDWTRAREIFVARVAGRYLDPVDLLVECEAETRAVDRRFGFTVLAIDCLLIETLQAFRWGAADTKGRSQKAFRTFLTERSRFAPHFDRATAERFYQDYRCGILHQAEIGGGSRVWSVGRLVWKSSKGLVVNRTRFHKYLAEEVANYSSALAAPGEDRLRVAFRKKMDCISEGT